MPTSIPTHTEDTLTDLKEPAESTHPEFPAPANYGGLICDQAGRESFDLTALDRQIISLTVEGCSREEKASTMGIGEEAFEAHLNTVLAKLGVSNEFELVLFAVYHQIVSTRDVSEGTA